jgi:hypothetical protein
VGGLIGAIGEPAPETRPGLGTWKTAAAAGGSRNGSSRPSRSPSGWRSRAPRRPSRSPAAARRLNGRKWRTETSYAITSVATSQASPPSSLDGSAATGRSRTSCTGSVTSPASAPPPLAPAPAHASWPPQKPGHQHGAPGRPGQHRRPTPPHRAQPHPGIPAAHSTDLTVSNGPTQRPRLPAHRERPPRTPAPTMKISSGRYSRIRVRTKP